MKKPLLIRRGSGRNRTRTCDPRDVNTVLLLVSIVYDQLLLIRNAQNSQKYWAFCHAHGCASCTPLTGCILALHTVCMTFAHGVHRVQMSYYSKLLQSYFVLIFTSSVTENIALLRVFFSGGAAVFISRSDDTHRKAVLKVLNPLL